MSIQLLIDKRSHQLSKGFTVGRVLPFRQRRMVGPFIFFDHMGPADFAPGIPREMDIRPHPHIGLSTVTYLYSGAMTHRDSLGFQQEITPGAVNWMTAGKGITHSERLEYARLHGAHMQGIQSWVALPDEFEECEPSFFHHASEELPTWQDGGVSCRVIAGTSDGLCSPVKTHSPLFYLHLTMQAKTRYSLSAEYSERAVYVAEGNVLLNGQNVQAGQLAVLSPGKAVTVQATMASTIMILCGEPIGQRFIDWNFVSSSQERLAQAKADWRAGRMKLPVGDDQEFIVLPE